MPTTNQEESLFQADEKLIEWMRDIRRTIHQHPELANEEHHTQRYICKKLQELGIPFRTDGLHTGIVATLGPFASEEQSPNCEA
jgi:metal-dependent amidase/aminoacylase/carboxypeptidase family protein